MHQSKDIRDSRLRLRFLEIEIKSFQMYVEKRFSESKCSRNMKFPINQSFTFRMICRICCIKQTEGCQHLKLAELSQGQVLTFFEVEALSTNTNYLIIISQPCSPGYNWNIDNFHDQPWFWHFQLHKEMTFIENCSVGWYHSSGWYYQPS